MTGQPTSTFRADCIAALAGALQHYENSNPKSYEYHESALQSLPGGNTRTLLHMAPFPIVMVRGEGSKLFDLDGHEYTDFVGELTACISGHSDPRIKESIANVLANVGLNLGSTNVYEKKYSELLCARFSLETLRFANSGTEANLHCVAAARQFTGKRKVVVFRGGYHGSVLSFAAGSAPNNVDQQDWIVSQYNDVDALAKVFAMHEGDIAAVLVEGMQGSGGAIPASMEFLRAVRVHTQKTNAIFILDEVMTSRLHPGGMAATFGPQGLAAPDMKTFGKYLGGGMPFGAFGGRRDIMAVYDPRTQGSLSHSGTFQNNTLMLNAGYTGLYEVYTPEVAVKFNQRGEALRAQLRDAFQGTRFTVTGVGSLMCIHATTVGLGWSQIRCKDDWTAAEDGDLKKLFWLEMLHAGYWLHPRGSIALNLALEEGDLGRFVAAVRSFCAKYGDMIRLQQ